MSSLNYEIRENILLASVAGRIDGQSGPVLQEMLLPAMGGVTHAIYDVTDVPYMSSAGFRLLLLLCRTASAKGGQSAIVGLSDEIRETMEMTGFLDFFLVCSTQDEALAKVRNEQVSPVGAH